MGLFSVILVVLLLQLTTAEGGGGQSTTTYSTTARFRQCCWEKWVPNAVTCEYCSLFIGRSVEWPEVSGEMP